MRTAAMEKSQTFRVDRLESLMEGKIPAIGAGANGSTYIFYIRVLLLFDFGADTRIERDMVAFLTQQPAALLS